MWFTQSGICYQFTRHVTPSDAGPPLRRGLSAKHARSDDPLALEAVLSARESVEQLVIQASFVGAHRSAEAVGMEELAYKCNYFLGSDPEQWRAEVPNYAAVTIKNLYPGIDVRFSGNGPHQVKYDFIVAPGADVRQIKVTYQGQVEASLDAQGRLIARTAWGSKIGPIDLANRGTGWLSPQRESNSEFGLGRVGDGLLHVASPAAAVELTYSTYLGGSSSDWGSGIAVDGNGNAYVAGTTQSFNFPTQNPVQPDQGGDDVFVSKLSSAGNQLLYSTYLGGSSFDEACAIAVDLAGQVYVTGRTSSSNFPTVSPYQLDGGGDDGFVAKLSAAGNSLEYSTYLGGNSSDRPNGISLDGSGRVCLTGYTTSTNFPTQNPIQLYQGGGDGFVTRLSSSGDSLLFSTYLGGSGFDLGAGIAMDSNGGAFITGSTSSSDFPIRNSSQTPQGYQDAFVTRFSDSGDSLIYSTYLGGNDWDAGYSIAVGSDGTAFVAGVTTSSNFPTQSPYQLYLSGDDLFVTRLSSTGDSLVYSTCLGGSSDENLGALVLDDRGRAYVTGYTTSADFPTQCGYQTHQNSLDAIVSVFADDGSRLMYSTCLGGGSSDGGASIVLSESDIVYVAGWTESPDFPVQNPFHTHQGGRDVFVTKLSGLSNVDGDSLLEPDDNCLCVANEGQENVDGDAFGDVCDNCVQVANSSQEDLDDDGEGDACDLDNDNDGVPDTLDNCLLVVNANQTDADGDAVGDACDNCPYAFNPLQEDSNHNGRGDSCNCLIEVSGDVNNSHSVTSADIITLVNAIFKGPNLLQPCQAAGDVNCSGTITSADIIRLVNYVFKGTAEPCDICEDSPLGPTCD